MTHSTHMCKAALSNTIATSHTWLVHVVVLYFVAIFKNFEVKILLLNRTLRYFCFKLVGKCQLLSIFLPNINSHLGVKDSNLGIKHPYTHYIKALSLKMDVWLFKCPVATNVASKGILLDTAGVEARDRPELILQNLILNCIRKDR